MSDIKRARRYYLLKRLAAKVREETELEAVWHGKQIAEPGTALPDGFPSKAALAAVGYTTIEDVDGADADELKENVSLRQYEADAVVKAVAALV